MAKRKVNKSAAIRELYAKQPKLPVSEAVKQLAEGGIKVAPKELRVNKCSDIANRLA